jgi:hypothetical protein
MFNLGKIIKEGVFSNSDCREGRLRLYEHGIEAISVEPRNKWTGQLKFEGFTSFREHPSGKEFHVNRGYYYHVDSPKSWIRAIKKALRAKGIKYKQSDSYRVVE